MPRYFVFRTIDSYVIFYDCTNSVCHPGEGGNCGSVAFDDDFERKNSPEQLASVYDESSSGQLKTAFFYD